MVDDAEAPSTVGDDDRSPEPREPKDRRRFVPGLAALAGGVLVAFSLPPWGWWPLAFVGVALFDRAVADAPAWSRFRRAWLTGVGVLGPSTIWMAAFTPPGYLIQAVVFSGFLGLTTMACPPGRWRWLALPGAWVVFEAVKGRWPFGGVPLSELAMGQVAGPLGSIARVGGVILVGLVTVVVGLALSALAQRAWKPGLALVATVLLALGLAAEAPRAETTGTSVRVAYVQGGGEQGTADADTDDREVFLAHIDATRDAIEPGSVDLIVWPENVVNVDGQIEDEQEGTDLADLARDLRTPVIAGVVEGAGPDRFFNASIVFDTDGSVVARYDKVRRVPFGEFVPVRSTLEKVAGGALPSKDAIAGDAQNTFDVTVTRIVRSGEGDATVEARIGVMISWEVFFGDRGRDAANGDGDDAHLLVNPTNGSSYQGTLVQTQQVASSRLRAIESGRWVVQSAPTGFSAFVSDTGRVYDRSDVSERRVETRAIPFRQGRTLFMVWGPWPPFLLAVALIVGARLLARRWPTPDRTRRV